MQLPQRPFDKTNSDIILALGIDCEPDLFEPRSADPGEWQGILETHDLMSRFRHRAMRRLGRAVNFIWFWRCDPQIAHYFGEAGWAFSHFRSLIDDVSAYGDVHGIHPILGNMIRKGTAAFSTGATTSWWR